jgi:hypothetical protein
VLRVQSEAETVELSGEIAAGERRELELERDCAALAAGRRGLGSRMGDASDRIKP